MTTRKEGGLIFLPHAKEPPGDSTKITRRRFFSLLAAGAASVAGISFLRGNNTSEKTLITPETPITVTFADATFDQNLHVRESPKIIYEKYDFEVGNQNTKKNFSELVIENALIIRTDPRSITKIINNTRVVETVYDEWIMFSYGNEIFFVKHGKETEGFIHFKSIVEPEEKPQTEYTFDRLEKDRFGIVHIVVKNEDGYEMRVSRARRRTEENN